MPLALIIDLNIFIIIYIIIIIIIIIIIFIIVIVIVIVIVIITCVSCIINEFFMKWRSGLSRKISTSFKGLRACQWLIYFNVM